MIPRVELLDNSSAARFDFWPICTRPKSFQITFKTPARPCVVLNLIGVDVYAIAIGAASPSAGFRTYSLITSSQLERLFQLSLRFPTPKFQICRFVLNMRSPSILFLLLPPVPYLTASYRVPLLFASVFSSSPFRVRPHRSCPLLLWCALRLRWLACHMVALTRTPLS